MVGYLSITFDIHRADFTSWTRYAMEHILHKPSNELRLGPLGILIL